MLNQKLLRVVITAVICLSCSVAMMARDVITLRNGVDIQAIVYEIGDKETTYRRIDFLQGPVFRLNNSDIFRIVFDNGRVILFDENVAAQTQGMQQHPAQQAIRTVPQEQIIQQPEVEIFRNPRDREERTAINVGLLMGGGGLIGADFGAMVGNRISLQAGIGLPSVGFGINYHLRPYINSSFFSLQYNQLGFGNLHTVSTLGPSFNFRARRVFQAGVGFGFVIDKGDNFYNVWDDDTNMLINFNIGLFFPL